MQNTFKVGFFSIGLDTYWGQFKGLKENLLGYHAQIRKELEGYGAVVVDGGLVDTPVKARAAGKRFRAEGAEIVFLFISTYALSSTVLPVVQEAGLPVVVLNIQPVAQLDYETFNALGDRGVMTGVWLDHCQACSAPEIACAFNRAGIDYHLVTGYLQDPEGVAPRCATGWTPPRVRVGHARRTGIGVLGHYYCGMLDVYSDLAQQVDRVFGTHIELLEMCELHALREAVDGSANQVADKLRTNSANRASTFLPRANPPNSTAPPARRRRWTRWSKKHANSGSHGLLLRGTARQSCTRISSRR